jgi:hypothetical protein
MRFSDDMKMVLTVSSPVLILGVVLAAIHIRMTPQERVFAWKMGAYLHQEVRQEDGSMAMAVKYDRDFYELHMPGLLHEVCPQGVTRLRTEERAASESLTWKTIVFRCKLGR